MLKAASGNFLENSKFPSPPHFPSFYLPFPAHQIARLQLYILVIKEQTM